MSIRTWSGASHTKKLIFGPGREGATEKSVSCKLRRPLRANGRQITIVRWLRPPNQWTPTLCCRILNATYRLPVGTCKGPATIIRVCPDAKLACWQLTTQGRVGPPIGTVLKTGPVH